MKKTGKEGIQKGIISGTLAVVLVLTAVVGVDFSTRKDAKAGTGMNTGGIMRICSTNPTNCAACCA